MKVLCPYCNTESSPCFRSRDYNRRVTQEIFEHFRCPHCALIFISPEPENLGDYYPQEYHFIPDSTEFLVANADHEKYKIEIIQCYVKQGRLLEIGPSLGGFAYLAKLSGYKADAIEMDAKCSEFLNNVAEISTVNSSDACATLKTLDPYDVIAMWHVIEHMLNPWETLEVISEKINPGGILILAAPNPDAFQFHVMGRYWPHVDAPRHLMLIPIKLLVEKMDKLGMSLELCTTIDEGGLGWNTFGWESFFSNLSRLPIINGVLRKIGRLVAKALAPLETKEGKGSAYTMVFRKAA